MNIRITLDDSAVLFEAVSRGVVIVTAYCVGADGIEGASTQEDWDNYVICAYDWRDGSRVFFEEDMRGRIDPYISALRWIDREVTPYIDMQECQASVRSGVSQSGPALDLNDFDLSDAHSGAGLDLSAFDVPEAQSRSVDDFLNAF